MNGNVTVNISADIEPVPRSPSTVRSHNIITFAAAARPPAVRNGTAASRVTGRFTGQAPAICDAQCVQSSSGGTVPPASHARQASTVVPGGHSVPGGRASYRT